MMMIRRAGGRRKGEEIIGSTCSSMIIRKVSNVSQTRYIVDLEEENEQISEIAGIIRSTSIVSVSTSPDRSRDLTENLSFNQCDVSIQERTISKQS